MEQEAKNKKLLKTLVFGLGFLVFALVFYLIFLPFWPEIRYLYVRYQSNIEDFKNLNDIKEATEKMIVDSSPESSGNRVIIAKIGVSLPIVESESEDYGLARGAWRLPQGSTPDIGGNTIITGHRFKYLPPSNLTFYLLDKLEPGDIVFLRWENKDYYYKIKETKIVPADDSTILSPSEKPILTLFTCDPIWSEKNRLVMMADLIEN